MPKYNPFEEAFKRFEKARNLTRVKTFDELKEIFIGWADKKAPMTRKQEKALAIEAEKIGIAEHLRQEKYFKNGEIKTRWRDIVTGWYAKPNQGPTLPSWRKTETKYERGVKINTTTGERLIQRDARGHFLKKSEWRMIDRHGKEKEV